MSTEQPARVLAAAAAELSVKIADLTANVDTLGKRLGESDEKAKTDRDRNRRHKAILSLIVVFDIMLTFGVGYLYVQLDRARAQVVCPIYAQLLGANPESRPAGPDRDTLLRVLNVVHSSYDLLGCTIPIVTPAPLPPTVTVIPTPAPEH